MASAEQKELSETEVGSREPRSRAPIRAADSLCRRRPLSSASSEAPPAEDSPAGDADSDGPLLPASEAGKRGPFAASPGPAGLAWPAAAAQHWASGVGGGAPSGVSAPRALLRALKPRVMSSWRIRDWTASCCCALAACSRASSRRSRVSSGGKAAAVSSCWQKEARLRWPAVRVPSSVALLPSHTMDRPRGSIKVGAFSGMHVRAVRFCGLTGMAGDETSSMEAFSAVPLVWHLFGVATFASVSPSCKAALYSPRSRVQALSTCTNLNTLSPATALV